MSEEKTKKPFYKKWWFIGIIVIVLIGAIVNMGDDTAPTSNDKDSAQTQGTEENKNEEPQPEVVILGKDLAKAFDDNEIKANGDYKDKLAEISGKVYEIGESFGSTYIVLESFEEFTLTSVQCSFDDEAEIAKIAELSKGDEVTIIGTIDGLSMNVGVNDCKFK